MNDKEKAFCVKEPDMVEVVRCKDCSFGRYAGLGKFVCDMYPIVEKAHFYCAMGERKDNGKE